jgi:hypothetical protein
MQWYTTTRLSKHQELTPEGFLLCKDIAIARCGTQHYHASEVPDLVADGDGWVAVDRDPDEVFRDISIASFTGKPITDDHPASMVTPDNWEHLSIGNVQNVRRGVNGHHDCLVADLLITTRRGIDLVRSGKRALSVGYDAAYEGTSPGRAKQKNIVANHVALVDQGRCGPRCSIVDGAPAYDVDWVETEHPRGQPKNAGQFAETQAAGRENEAARREAKAAELEGRHHKGASFVSPSLADHLSFPEAVQGLQSRRQTMLEKASREIDKEIGLKARMMPAIGAWADGAENSIMNDIEGGSFDAIQVASAMKASIAEQKAALVFQDDAKGKAVLFSFPAKGSLDKIHQDLLDDGVEFHTVIPTKGGAMVYVVDTEGDEDAAKSVAKAARHQGSKVTFDRGRADFIGTTKQDGTDREQRDDAIAAYERIIRGSRVRGAQALWARIRDAYGETLHVTSDSWRDLYRDIDWEDWEEAKHPRGQPENKGEFAKGGSGGGGSSGGGSSYGSSYVRAGEAGEAAPGADDPEGQAKAFAAKIAGKVFSFAKEQLGSEDYEIVHEHFKNAKTRPKDRSKVSHGIRSMAKGLTHLAKAHVMEEAKHAKHAAGALKSLAMMQKPTPEQAKGLFSFGARALMVAGSMALGDPTGHAGAAIGNLVSTFGEDAVHHVMLEHAVKLFVGGSYGAVKGAVAKPQTDAAPGEDGQDKIPDKSGEGLSGGGDELGEDEIALLQQFLECLADTVDDMTEEDAMRIILQGETPDEDDEGGGDGEEESSEDDRPADGDDVDYSQTKDVDWVESEHPREGKGKPIGGEFTEGAGGSAAYMASIREKKGEAKASKREGAAAKREANVEGAGANIGGLKTPAQEKRAAETAARQAQRATEKAAAKEAATKAKIEANRIPKIPRSKEEPFGISTRIPSEPQQKKTSLDVHETAQQLVDYQSTFLEEVQDWLKKATDLLVGRQLYNPGLEKKVEGQPRKKKPIKPYVGMRPGPEGETPREAAERFIEFAKGNILALHDAVDESWRERASKWYDGACKIAGEWGDHYGKSRQQIAGVIAAQSPKKDWFQNVEVARRILEYNSDAMKDTTFNQAAAERLDEFVGTRKKDEDIATYTAMRAKFFTADGKGVRLGDLTSPIERAAFISMYDQGNADNKDLVPEGLHYRELSPEGKYGDYVRNKDVDPEEEEEEDEDTGRKAKKAKPGKMGDPTVLVWPVMENIAKGLKILDNGSVENISKNLGDAHKVRNFYMNIAYPQSKGGHVTIDTHAIAGAFMRPLGQNDPEVLVGLGNSSPSNNTHGMGGTYPLIAEAYRRAAKDRGILPRQMQSIAWEGLRGLFSPEAKRDKNLRTNVDRVWKYHMEQPNYSADQARKDIMQIANPGPGKPRTPKWYARTET